MLPPRRIAILFLAVALWSCAAPPGHLGNPALLDLPAGQWTKIHQQRPDDAVVFARQRHGGSAFDSLRGRLVLFGSDTHGSDWSNGPRFFDVARLRWGRLYPDDDPATYRVNGDGVPVAGPRGDHPWAMHTFGAVIYDSRRDSLVVASYPAHLEPGRFTDDVADQWPRIGRHPTWVLDLNSGRWAALAGPAEHFFAFAASYDPSRGAVIGYRRSGVYELSGASRQWEKLAEPGLLRYALNVAFDTRRRALVAFGGSDGSNDIVIYRAADGRHEMKPTPGPRPPKSRYAPMAYHPGVDRTVVLAERKVNTADGAGRTETWLYDLGTDSWTRVASAALPFFVGMNFNLEFDPIHKILLLVANPPHEPTAVWALRFK